jgi:hypothetical protein
MSAPIIEVRRSQDDLEPAARVIIHVQVGEVIETPVVFWAVVFVWPMATLRRRLVCVAVGIPMFLVLEAATTGCQLVHSMADASAMLAGEADPLTAWERWSRFLEAGGRCALELCAALLTVASSSWIARQQLRSDAPRRVKAAAAAREKLRHRELEGRVAAMTKASVAPCALSRSAESCGSSALIV